MHFALDTQNFLRPRDANVIYPGVAVMPEACAIAGAAERGEPGTASSAMQVEAQAGSKSPHGVQVWRQDFVHGGIGLEDVAEAALDSYGDAQIGPMALQNIQRRRGQDTVPQGTKPEDCNPA